MVSPPQPGLYAAARRVLLDALEALEDHLDSLVLVGAQAVYLRAGESMAIAEPPYTTDGDLSIDPRSLADQPLLAERLRAADFHPARERDESRVGTWEKLVPAGSVPNLAEDAVVGVDLLVPEAIIRVAGPAALLVAKAHKIADRIADAERGRVDLLKGGKDLLDTLRLYETQNLDGFAASLRRCLVDETAATATGTAIEPPVVHRRRGQPRCYLHP